MVAHSTARAVWPGAPLPKGKLVAPRRSAPTKAPQLPTYRLKTAATITVSSRRSPAPQRMRAWASPMRSQSSLPMPKTVGRPVVPDVP